MRLIKTIWVLGCAVILLAIASPAQAKNNQTVVIGGSFGAYNFNDDELDKIKDLYYGSEFIEWYLLDVIGIGIRTHKFYQTGSTESDESLLMVNIDLTLNWIVFGSADDLRMGIYGGAGSGRVDYSKKSEASEDVKFNESGPTTSFGFFFDWGGETWGVRLSHHRVFAKFDYDLNDSSETFDATGSAWDLGVRMAF